MGLSKKELKLEKDLAHNVVQAAYVTENLKVKAKGYDLLLTLTDEGEMAVADLRGKHMINFALHDADWRYLRSVISRAKEYAEVA